eukprot:XP_015137880.1 uncharacterized protein LOC107052666 [Gallus gallus]
MGWERGGSEWCMRGTGERNSAEFARAAPVRSAQPLGFSAADRGWIALGLAARNAPLPHCSFSARGAVNRFRPKGQSTLGSRGREPRCPFLLRRFLEASNPVRSVPSTFHPLITANLHPAKEGIHIPLSASEQKGILALILNFSSPASLKRIRCSVSADCSTAVRRGCTYSQCPSMISSEKEKSGGACKAQLVRGFSTCVHIRV